MECGRPISDLTTLLGSFDKPTLIGEFSFPPTYDLIRGYGVYNL